jgi:hypothetical protein
MDSRRRRWIGLAGLAATSLLALGAASPVPVLPEDRPVLRTDAERLVLPPVGRDDLLPATASPGTGSQRSSLSLDVEPPRADRGWELTVRTGSLTGQGAAARPPRVYWKLDSEPPSDFRPLGPEEQLVRRSPRATPERITIDVVFGVGWNVVPGRYDVELLFSVEPL